MIPVSVESSHASKFIDEGLSVSIVTYHSDAALLARTLASLCVACDIVRATRSGLTVRVQIVDNGGLPDLSKTLEMFDRADIAYEVFAGHGNVGYGRGHNLAIDTARSRYHLVLNPDIDLEPDALVHALDFLDVNPEVALLSPWIGDDARQTQYLCRRYPALLDLFVRGFLPVSWRKWFARRLARYEMQDRINEFDVVWDPPIVSGCFMLFRTVPLKALKGFDPRYFLYLSCLG
ncbi:glycosyltransferase [Burkholderia multivorans]|uniref:glycosyltransferase n=1 Tax=Burkholderia multivorans TaxID=87883 RepID=UPI0030C8B33D